MKILLAYYSKTGNTENLANAIKDELERRGHVIDVEKIKPKKEHGLFGWTLIRTIKGECDIEPPKIGNVSDYDVVCVGSPNWTRVSLPVARYLSAIKGLKGKKVGIFATTTMWPSFEWFVFSAYFLDLTFTRAIEKRGAKIISNILLSGLFKKWNFSSDRGKRAINDFCDKIESAVVYSNDYFVRQRESGRNKALIIIFSVFFALTFLAQAIIPPLGLRHFTWMQYSEVIVPGVFALFSILALTKEGKRIFLPKYLACFYLAFAWTMTVYFFGLTSGSFILPGYILVIIVTIFFQELNLVIFSGFAILLCYLYLYFFHTVPNIFYPQIDVTWIFVSTFYAALIAKNLQDYSDKMLKIQEETEIEKVTLEIKVKARTRELRELASGLDKQIKDKTKELQKKVDELEDFSKIAIGREFKMMELKKENKDLKGILEKK